MIEVEVNNQQSRLPIDEGRIQSAVTTVLEGEGVKRAVLSVAVLDDPTLRELNRQYLAHDYATDVLSFLLEDGPAGLEGEILASADTALRHAADLGCDPFDELLLYIVHGTLHVAGYDDQDPVALQAMREKEARYLSELGVARTE